MSTAILCAIYILLCRGIFFLSGSGRVPIIHSLSPHMSAEEYLQLKAQFVGLLDVIQKECNVDELFADAVIQVVSEDTFKSVASFIEHLKSKLADFLISELMITSKPKEITHTDLEQSKKNLEEIIMKMESFLRVLTSLRTIVNPPKDWTGFVQSWTRTCLKKHFGIYETDNLQDWKRKTSVPTLASVIISPFILLNGSLKNELWSKIRNEKGIVQPNPFAAIETSSLKTKSSSDLAVVMGTDAPQTKKAKKE